jgi:tRNA(Leu) C34 or U34 (ribose-2'-O)-methylase TrmL
VQSTSLRNDSTVENEQTQPNVDTVTIESEPSADSPSFMEYDPHKLMDNKTGVGKVIQDVTNAFEVYILDDAIPFEKVAKKAGTSLDASWHATRNSFSSAQHFIGNGNEAQGVRDEILALCDQNIILPMEKDVESLNVGVAAAILMWELKK